ncbi:hypothetical protein KPL28_03395 [Clostridium algidicarnis]|uniref:hypothetical protein n=1 Tax=Clostridium algidicarnis TaxID=37659 RepID=UPI001C0E0057|nr:hypothetical protein [Clostridium algidicarnis]MBU3208681.1 hypothetical protein [Clostridium algidicarnis]
MAISSVKVMIDGSWHTLALNSSTGKYEKTITAPNKTSYNINVGHYYPLTVEALNTAGTKITVNDSSPSVGNDLKLIVKERVKPTINITSPGEGAYVINSRQPIVFQVRDEPNGSGVNISTLTLKIDNGAVINNNSPGIVCTEVSNGYDVIYTPPAALIDGLHTININVSDFDSNTAIQAVRKYTVDTVPPILNVTNPANNFIINNANMVINGTTNDATSSPVTVAIKLNNIDQGPVVINGGNFSKMLTLKEGSNNIIITSTDAAGRTTTVTITGVLDTSVPVISSISVTPNPVDSGATMVIAIGVSG